MAYTSRFTIPTSRSKQLHFFHPFLFRRDICFKLSQSLCESLVGSIPTSFALLTSLVYLNLGNNGGGTAGTRLSGILPSFLGLYSQLTFLSVEYNSLTGTVPESLGQLSSLVYIYITGNSFEGSIPSTIGQWSSIMAIRLSKNSFTGTLPTAIGQLTSLVYFAVTSNGLRGSLPASLGQLSSITSLSLDKNAFTGSIPSTVEFLTALTLLRLGSNSLTGAIPSGLCRAYSYSLSLAGGHNAFSCYAPCLSSVSTISLGTSVQCPPPSHTQVY